jgi:hypothetical protein
MWIWNGYTIRQVAEKSNPKLSHRSHRELSPRRGAAPTLVRRAAAPGARLARLAEHSERRVVSPRVTCAADCLGLARARNRWLFRRPRLALRRSVFPRCSPCWCSLTP